MTTLIAIAHIIGALIALSAFSGCYLMLTVWEDERNRGGELEEISIALRIPVDEIDNTEHEMRVVQFVAERFSSELLRNRLSDLCGLIQTIWDWLGVLLLAGTLFNTIRWA